MSIATGTGLSGSVNFTANQAGNSSVTIDVASTHKLPTTAEWNALPTTNTTYTAGTGLSLTGTTFANTAPNVQADWNATSGLAQILNKPNIPAQLVYTGSNGINVTGTVISPTYGTTAGTIAQGNDSRFHNAVTLGTANGLSLANQVLSLGLVNSTNNGALSSNDWNTFNNKVSANNGTFNVQGTGAITGSGSTSANTSSNTSATLDLTAQTKIRYSTRCKCKYYNSKYC